jgi:hypothetical protein
MRREPASSQRNPAPVGNDSLPLIGASVFWKPR